MNIRFGRRVLPLIILLGQIFFMAPAQAASANAWSCRLNKIVQSIFNPEITPEQISMIEEKLIESENLKDLSHLPGLTQNQSTIWNEKVLQDLKSRPVSDSANRITHATRDQAKAIFDKVKNDPVVGMSRLKKYDPTGTKGFCFGRAFAAHLESLRTGINQPEIRKIFAMGSFQQGWSFHVATIIRGEGSTWWAIDPIFDDVLSVDEWYRRMSAYSYSKKTRILTFPAKRLLPEERPGRDAYKTAFSLNPKYFEGFLKNFKAESKDAALRKQLLKSEFQLPAVNSSEAVGTSDGRQWIRKNKGNESIK